MGPWKNYCNSGRVVFVISPQTRATLGESAYWYGETVSGQTIYAYVNDNPVNYKDPKGLVKWNGNVFSAVVSAPFGAAYVEATLLSDCVNGQRMRIEVTGVGPAAGVGVKLSATASEISFEDNNLTLDPFAFNGGFTTIS